MNRRIKAPTVKRSHYESRHQLGHHLVGFVSAYNWGQRLKILNP